MKESEQLAKELAAVEVPCVVLNAKNDDEEAAIIAEAGRYGAVTVSTQMAGRGVDIRLGGSDQADRERVAELGGLLMIGSGRHDSRRVDDQLRGRAGRQGDPGGSLFFVSLEDGLIMRHAANTIPASPKMTFEGLVTDEQVDWAIEHAQRVSEGVNAEIHRNTWRYSVVIEQQRKVLAERRERLLTTDVAAEMLRERYPERFPGLSDGIAEDEADSPETDPVEAEAAEVDVVEVEAAEVDAVEVEPAEVEPAEIEVEVEDGDEPRPLRVVTVDDETFSKVARSIALCHLDRLWAEHLATLSEVREGVHLRALGRLDPLDEFHREAVPAFNDLVPEIEVRTIATFEELDVTEDWQPDDAGLVRPSATWTYLVYDNPFGSELDRLVAAVGRRLGDRR